MGMDDAPVDSATLVPAPATATSEFAPLIVRDLPEGDGVADRTQTLQSKLDRAHWPFKIAALVCSVLLSVGSHYAASMPNALKCTLKLKLGISNTQFGLLTAASTLINTIVPVFGGAFVDVFGTAWGAVVASTLIMVGELLTAGATSIDSYTLMVVGRIIYGLGSGCIVTVQEAILSHWFQGRGLALAVGIQLSISRLAGFLAVGTAIPLCNATGSYATAFWISAVICIFSWLVMLLYLVMMRYIIGETSDDIKTQERLQKKHRFEWMGVFNFNHTFWIIATLSFLFGLTWAPFESIAPELIAERFGSDDDIAAWQTSVSLALPIVLNPVLGGIIEKIGKRTIVVNIAAILLAIAFVLVSFTAANPLGAMVLYSISLSFGPVAMITSVPLLVPFNWVGTALGIYKCASNIGTTIMQPLIGSIQDSTGSYDNVMLWLFIASLATIVGTFTLSAASQLGHAGLLDAAEEKRIHLMRTVRARWEDTTQGLKRRHTLVWVILLAILLVLSWVLYITLAVMSIHDDSGTAAPCESSCA